MRGVRLPQRKVKNKWQWKQQRPAKSAQPFMWSSNRGWKDEGRTSFQAAISGVWWMKGRTSSMQRLRQRFSNHDRNIYLRHSTPRARSHRCQTHLRKGGKVYCTYWMARGECHFTLREMTLSARHPVRIINLFAISQMGLATATSCSGRAVAEIDFSAMVGESWTKGNRGCGSEGGVHFSRVFFFRRWALGFLTFLFTLALSFLYYLFFSFSRVFSYFSVCSTYGFCPI